MSFFGFEQNEVLPYHKTNAAQHDFKIQQNMKNLAESAKIAREQNAIKEQMSKQQSLNEAAKNIINPATKQRRLRRLEDAKLESQLLDKVLVGFLTETTYKGLVFDEDYLDLHEDALKKNLGSYIGKMLEEGTISHADFTNNGNTLLESAYNQMKSVVKSKIQIRDFYNIFSEDAVSEILSEADVDDLAEEIADAVKEKVKETIKTEKSISKKKEDEANDEDLQDEVADAADSLDDDTIEDSDVGDDEDLDDEDLEDGDDEDLDDEDLDDEDLDDEDLNDEETEDDDLESDVDSDSLDTDGEPAASTTVSTGEGTPTVQIVINANKNESSEFSMIFGSKGWKERTSKSIFRNLLEGNTKHYAQGAVLSEDSGVKKGVNMDQVLAETIVGYTLLETLFTSKIFNLSAKDLQSLNKTINFKRD